MTSLSLSTDGDVLSLTSEDTSVRFHAIWLRDNALDSATRSPGNGQRLITVGDIPRNLKMVRAEMLMNQVQIHFAPEGISLTYQVEWLLQNAYDKLFPARRGWLNDQCETWGSELVSKLPIADFDIIQSDQGALRTWLAQVASFGFAKLRNGPVLNESLLEVVKLFGYVRETNYGRYFDVRSELNPSNLAYTGLGLQAHTDNPYRDPAPSLQILYCLENTANGGENFVVDGFRVAQKLREENTEWFDVLCQYCAHFEFSGAAGVALKSRKPMIELTPDGELVAIRFNNRSAAAFTDVPFEKMQTYYAAYRRFGEMVDDISMQVNFRLEPGECFIVNNARVLHARKPYSGAGTRWLQGCYADIDSLHSTLRSLV